MINYILLVITIACAIFNVWLAVIAWARASTIARSARGGESMRHKMRQWKVDLLTAFGAGMSIGVLIGMLGYALVRSFFW